MEQEPTCYCLDCKKKKNASYHSDKKSAFLEWEVAKKEFGIGSSEESEAWEKINNLGKKTRAIKIASSPRKRKVVLSISDLLSKGR